MSLLKDHHILSAVPGALSKRATAAAITERFQSAKEARKDIEQQWYVNLSYHLGTPVSEDVFSEEETDFNTDPLPKLPTAKEMQVIHNYMMPAVLRVVSKMTQHLPYVSCYPATMEPKHIEASRIAGKLLEVWRRDLFNNTLRIEFATWAAVTGASFLRIGWDSYAGDTLESHPLAPGGEAILPSTRDSGFKSDEELVVDRWASSQLSAAAQTSGNAGRPQITEEVVADLFAQGDVTVEVVNPFEMYPEPNVTSWDKLTWVIHARMRSREDVAAVWGRRVAKKAASSSYDSDESGGYNPAKMGDYDQSPWSLRTNLMDQPDPNDDMVLILDYWERPSKSNPAGRNVTVIGGEVVADRDNPFPFRTFPFAYFPFEMIPNSIWGRGLVDSLIPALDEYNQTLSDIALAREFVCHPPLLVPRGADLMPSFTGNFPGRTWEYNYPQEPHFAAPPQMPSFLGPALEFNFRAFQDLSHQHEASMGNMPANARAGISLQLLQEADDAVLGPMFKLQDDAIRRSCQMLLMLAQEYYVEERTIRLIGASKSWQVESFTSTDIAGAADVFIESRSALPETLAGRRQMVLDMYQMGLLGSMEDPVTRKRVLKMMDLGHFWEFVQEEQTLDEQVLAQLTELANQSGGVGALVQALRGTAAPAEQQGQLPQAQGPGPQLALPG